MSLIRKNLLDIKLGEYSVGNATAVEDPKILPQVQQYKRQVASRLFPLAQHDIKRKIPDAEYLVSRKLDGEFTVLVYRDGELFTINPGGRVRLGFHWMPEAKTLLDAAGITDCMIAGELYATNEENRRPRVHDVVSLARQPQDESDLERLQFAVFDLLRLDGETVDQPYSVTWKKIDSVFKSGKCIHPVETIAVKSDSEIETQFEKWVVDEKSEGIVVRSDTGGNFKLKPLHTLDAVVIGFTESTEDRQGMMHDLLLAVARPDGALQVLCRVGGGFSDEQRREMLSDLNDMVVESEYAEVNSDHVAYQMVRPEWVVEISCLDVIAQNTRGRVVNRMVLDRDPAGAIFNVVRRMPLVSVISPQFKRIREDKSFKPGSSDYNDIRIEQVTDIVPVAQANIDATELTLAKSKLMQREVYVKQLRGETLVRKFLLWKTNKETESEEFPAYVVYHADFSPTRKTPLTREVRVSNSETQILALWHQLKEENIKKGWKLHSDSVAD